MKKNILYLSLVLLTLFVSSFSANAQEERKFIRKGNKQFTKGDFVAAEVDYLRALDKDSTSYAAIFNLGDALYKQGKFEDALAKFSILAKSPTLTENSTSLFYNVGNSHFEMKKYEESIESYKNSLRLNPSDTTAKFNLAYAQAMLQGQQDQEKKDDKDKDKDKDKKEDKEDKDSKNKKDKEDGEDKEDEKKDQEKKDQEKKDGKPKEEPKISKEQAEKMLQAIQGNEDKTQQKVKDKKGVIVNGSGKNW